MRRRRSAASTLLHGVSVALLAWLLGWPVEAAAAGESDAAQRGRIESERAAAETTFEQRQRDCTTRFVVTSCLDAARREQRETLSRLRAQEMLIDDAQRKARVAERLADIEDNRRSRPAAMGASAGVGIGAGEVASPSTRQAAPRTEPRSEPRSGSAPAKVSQADRRAEELRKLAEFEERRNAARLRREAIEKRHAERKARGKVAAPLPLPPGASAPP